MRVGSETPWGEAQTVDTFSNGIFGVTTAGHGGFIVPREYADANFSERHLWAANDCVGWWPGSDFYYAFEEDCACLAVIAEVEEIRNSYSKPISQEKADEWFEQAYGERIAKTN